MQKTKYIKTDGMIFRALWLASGQFLNKRIPNNWNTMKKHEQLNFIEKNIFAPYKGLTNDIMYDNLYNLANEFEEYGEFCASKKADVNVVVKF
jgi:hypothetical protein|tara:strand:- start:1820 stop:2098 length:279 start_codon:yes stop_codon:yes gene_type:complete